MNPFLVILNAEIKFRRLLTENPRPELPDGVMELINKTIYLVELIYIGTPFLPKTPEPGRDGSRWM